MGCVDFTPAIGVLQVAAPSRAFANRDKASHRRRWQRPAFAILDV